MAAIHSRFMTPSKKSKPISAQQQPRQKAPSEMDAVCVESDKEWERVRASDDFEGLRIPPAADLYEQLRRLAAEVSYSPVPLLPDYRWSEIRRMCQ